MTESLAYLPVCLGVLALLFVVYLIRKVGSADPGTERMQEIASHIHEGAKAFLMAEYKILIVFVVILFFAIGLGISWITAISFLVGALFSTAAGYIGMNVATKANVRTAAAAKDKGMNGALSIAFSGGAVMGMCVVGFGLFGACLIYLITGSVDALSGFSLGASSIALFARVGGGIYTKAADVGADLVGKVEAGIPEDDPRNPATIADNVGDNVGDVAGMGADLYESYVGSILATFALGPLAGYGYQGMLLPIAIAVTGILCSVIGTFLVKTDENTDQLALLGSLRKGTYSAAVMAAIIAAPLTIMLVGNIGVYIAILCGLAGGTAIGYFTEYYTSDSYKPTQKLSESSQSGAAPLIIGGISLGLKSTMASILIVAAAVMISFAASGGFAEYNRGLYGIGIAAVGMLSTLGITLATDAYGPVADNAGGIAEMSGLPEMVRERTDALDSLGNTTAATGKGFAIGSASLTSLALLVSYVSIADAKLEAAGKKIMDLSLTNPSVLVGLFIGAMLTFVLAAYTMNAVQNSAQSIVVEVRRQFREIKGIMEGKAKPDYASCVAICTKGALREMVVPALLAIIVPIVTGLILGCEGVVGLLGGVSVTGFAMAVFMSNAGGAWDNAKKYIEKGNFGGKGSENHKAAVVGDTVGDPFKDTSGPSLNILIKLCSTISIVFSGLIVAFNLTGMFMH